MLLTEHDLSQAQTVNLVAGVEMLKEQRVPRWFAAASERCRSCMSRKGATLSLNTPIV